VGEQADDHEACVRASSRQHHLSPLFLADAKTKNAMVKKGKQEEREESVFFPF
jgi:hypothetical protein